MANLVDKREEPYCEECKKVVYLVKDFLDASMTEDNFKSIIFSTCQSLGLDDSECQEGTDQYSNTLYNILSKGVEPSEACRAIQLCEGGISPKFEKRDAATPEHFDGSLVSETPDGTVTHLGKVKQQSTMRHLSKRFSFKNFGLCTACEKFLSSVDNILMTRQEDIKIILLEVCENLGYVINSSCKLLVRKYITSILGVMERALEPNSVCVKLKVCHFKQHHKA